MRAETSTTEFFLTDPSKPSSNTPTTVIDRAKTILERLEADDSSHNLLRKRMKKEKSGDDTSDEDDQLALF